MEKIKIKIEVLCEDCQGEGQFGQDDSAMGCSGCDSTGYQEILINLATLKHLLDGGDL